MSTYGEGYDDGYGEDEAQSDDTRPVSRGAGILDFLGKEKIKETKEWKKMVLSWTGVMFIATLLLAGPVFNLLPLYYMEADSSEVPIYRYFFLSMDDSSALTGSNRGSVSLNPSPGIRL